MLNAYTLRVTCKWNNSALRVFLQKNLKPRTFAFRFTNFVDYEPVEKPPKIDKKKVNNATKIHFSKFLNNPSLRTEVCVWRDKASEHSLRL